MAKLINYIEGKDILNEGGAFGEDRMISMAYHEPGYEAFETKKLICIWKRYINPKVV